MADAPQKLSLMTGNYANTLPLKEGKVRSDLVSFDFADVKVANQHFKQVVRDGRPKLKDDKDALAKVTTGQIFTAEQAQELGLVDKLGFIDSAIKRAAELAGRDPAKVICVKYDTPPSALGMLMGEESVPRPAARFDMSALLDLTAPRAYYLCTWLPAVLSNSR